MKRNKFIFYIIPFTIFLDIFYIFIPSNVLGFESPLAIVKAIVLILYFIILVLKGKIFYSKDVITIFLFAFYVLFLVMLSSNFIMSLRGSLTAIIPILMYAIARSEIKDFNDIKLLNERVVLAIYLLVLNMIVSNYFKIGISDYTMKGDYRAGSLQDSYNVFTYILLVIPLVIGTISSKKKRVIVFILSIILFILLLLTMKRIAIFGFFFGYSIYFLFDKNRTKKIKYILTAFIFFIILINIFWDLLVFRFDARANKGAFQENFYEKEYRYYETYFVWKDILSFNNINRSLFGREPFNSAGTYGGESSYFFGNRVLHVDYNKIAYTTGLVGLFLYLLLFWHIFLKFRKAKKYLLKEKFFLVNELIATFYALFFTSFFTSIAGQMQHIAFRNILFIYLGSIINMLLKTKNLKYEHENLNNW